jgi:peptidoglycan/LPS O-acetylase OafA/YrhL
VGSALKPAAPHRHDVNLSAPGADLRVLPEKSLLHPLTSLRFVAAAMVVVVHAQVTCFGSLLSIGNTLPLGQAVSFFFVLSGFILAYNHPVLATRRSVMMFYAARIARVWPAHIATTLIVMALGTTAWPLVYVVVNMSLLQSWTLLSDVALSLNSVAWSLSVELFFYLAFPLLVWRWRETWHWKVLSAASLALAMIVLGNHFNLSPTSHVKEIGLAGLIYTNPVARLLEFVMGICSASIFGYVSRHRIRWSVAQATVVEIGVVLLAILALRLAVSIDEKHWFGEAGHFYFSYQGSGFIWPGLVLVFALERGLVSRVLSHPLAVKLGEISFALYLLHYAIVLPYFSMFEKQIAIHPLLWYALFWLVCLTMAYATFIGVEQPARVMLLTCAKRLIKPGSPAPFPPARSVITPVALGLGTIFCILTVGALVKPHDLAAVPGPQALLQATPVQAAFDDKLSLEAVRLCALDKETVELAYLLKPLSRSRVKETLEVHLLDASGKVVGQLNHAVDNAQPTLEQGGYWLRRVTFRSYRLQEVARMRLAMYVNGGKLYPIRGAGADRDGRHLTLPLPVSWKDRCERQPDLH